MHNLGLTRSALRPDHLLQTPDTFVRTPLPCLRGGHAVIHIGPARGAAFTQFTAELEPAGELHPSGQQRLLFLLEGTATLTLNAVDHPLTPGSYAFLPQSTPHLLRASSPIRCAVIEKPFLPLPNHAQPAPLVSHEHTLTSTPLLGDDALQVRTLLPTDPAFDFAVNTMTYQPGAALPMVEIHVMEHGLLMLEGGGIYRLSDSWYPVSAGDFLWMAPFCPQWFGALGKQPAKYLIYKDTNRHPLA